MDRNSDYMKLMKLRDKLYTRWKLLPNKYTEAAFKEQKNWVNTMRNKLKKEYTQRKFLEARENAKKHGMC